MVYLACLELDYATNSQITLKTKLNRITNYEILKRLEKKGIIAAYLNKGKKFFMAVDPRVVIRQTKEKLLIAESKIPDILSLVNSLPKKPKIKYFEGIDGIKNIYEDSLTAKEKILTFTNPKDLYSFFGDYAEMYMKERVKNSIRVQALAPDNEDGEQARREDMKVLRQTRLFPEESYQINNEVMLYDNKIAIFSGKDEIGLIIENKTLAQTFTNIWQMAWDNCEKIDLNEK